MIEEWITSMNKPQPIVKIPLQFLFQPVEILSKQLTKLNSPYPYRIHYLGPRWENSATLHKKYANKDGYSFNDRQINKNNNFLTESMGRNQFYKNEVYYRAFQGMNPTIDKQQLQFNSRFQSGNLDCVVKVGPQEYDLFLRIDSNTRGQLFWFYFQISNCKPDTTIKLNICNMTKSIDLYQKGFKPFTCLRDSYGQFKNWSQDACFDVNVTAKKLRYEFIYERIKVRRLMQLTFKYKFQSKNPVRFAYCIPYTYSQMLADVKRLESLKIQDLRVGTIGRSLTGVELPFVSIGKQNQNQEKPVIVCIGRLHPGQTNGSHILQGVMNYICSSNEAEYIRKKLITIFIPMLNPDGVIMGNSRVCASGRDLNRQFKSKNNFLNPQICNLKKFCNKILQTNDIQMFFDFHGHSRKKNMFFFGPNYNITQVQYYKSRVMPKFLSQITSIFRYFGCDYSIPPNKSSTARAVMLQQLNIPYVYAIETSIGQYYDYQMHKTVAFGLKKWLELGSDVGRAIKQYFESVQQYQDFEKKSKGDQQPTNKTVSPNKNLKNTRNIMSPDKGKKGLVLNIKQKDLKLLKIFEEIKASEQQKKLKKKKQEESENDSDSENQEENLEGKKRAEFEGMVAQCIETEKRRQDRQMELMNQYKSSKLSKQSTLKPKRERNKQKDSNMMKDIMKNNSINVSFSNPQPQPEEQSINKMKHRRTNKSEDNSKKDSCQNHANKTSRSAYQQVITQHIYFDDILPENMAQKQRKNNNNLRMFNFSKVIQQTQHRNISTSNKKYKNRYLASLREINTLDCSSEMEQNLQIVKFNNTLNKISLEEGIKMKQIDEDTPQKEQSQNNSKKMKGLYPASFYRIKYQNFKKKQNKDQEEYRQQKSKVLRSEHLRNIEQSPKRDLFLNIKKVDKR